jgi:hypothetical protein
MDWVLKVVSTFIMILIVGLPHCIGNGPWNRLGNRFDVTEMDSESYSTTVSPMHSSGILGDISVSVSQVA